MQHANIAVRLATEVNSALATRGVEQKVGVFGAQDSRGELYHTILASESKMLGAHGASSDVDAVENFIAMFHGYLEKTAPTPGSVLEWRVVPRIDETDEMFAVYSRFSIT